MDRCRPILAAATRCGQAEEAEAQQARGRRLGHGITHDDEAAQIRDGGGFFEQKRPGSRDTWMDFRRIRGGSSRPLSTADAGLPAYYLDTGTWRHPLARMQSLAYSLERLPVDWTPGVGAPATVTQSARSFAR